VQRAFFSFIKTPAKTGIGYILAALAFALEA
jgi:hypothetical protein